MLVRIEGEFLESLELQCFPWDFQELTVKAAFLCANEGIVPVQVYLPQDLVGDVDFSRFVFHNVFRCVEGGVA